MYSSGLVQLLARDVSLGLEIRVLAVSSILTEGHVSVEAGSGGREGVRTHMSDWWLSRCLPGGRCPDTPFLRSCQHHGQVGSCLAPALTIAVKQRQARDVCAVGVQRPNWRLAGFGESETSRKSVESERDRRDHRVNAIRIVR